MLNNNVYQSFTNKNENLYKYAQIISWETIRKYQLEQITYCQNALCIWRHYQRNSTQIPKLSLKNIYFSWWEKVEVISILIKKVKKLPPRKMISPCINKHVFLNSKHFLSRKISKVPWKFLYTSQARSVWSKKP